MKLNDRFVRAIEFAYNNSLKNGTEIRFGIPGAMAMPLLISPEEYALLVEAGFQWDEESQCWITDVKDMFDAS